MLTHCNAGALATAGYGTALGVIRAAVEAGKKISVIADETRPFLQGARLTAWELQKDNIPVTLICDNMAGYLMSKGEIDAVIVGADRIAANGDVANKIGTYTVAVLARAHNIPFYVAAPVSTVDLTLGDGSLIPIEERDVREITHVKDVQLAPEGVKVRNPAFDITPHELISAIITENGVAEGNYQERLQHWFSSVRAKFMSPERQDISNHLELIGVDDGTLVSWLDSFPLLAGERVKTNLTLIDEQLEDRVLLTSILEWSFVSADPDCALNVLSGSLMWLIGTNLKQFSTMKINAGLC